ncbi:MAG: NAD(P)-dependent alcohol dehydrogenase [Acidobacteriota bacterium]|nr:NAD(P)-dependent alcohol dehydrogenase [Acidobacteriota bacterium]
MRALVRREYGSPDVLQLEEIRKPDPRDDELLIRVHAMSLNLGDWELLTGEPIFISVIATLLSRRPRVQPILLADDGTEAPHPESRGLLSPKHKILGTDISGRVEAVGKNVTQFQPGDELFGMCDFCGLAEYVCVPEKTELAHKPAGMTFEEAAAIPQAAFIALQALRDRERVQPGRRVLINGAGGGAGTFGVQIAKLLGAEVTAVDNTTKLDMMRSIGADQVIDYTQDDFTQTEERYDLILDLAAHRSIFDFKRILAPDGIYLLAGGGLGPTLQAAFLGPLISRTGSQKIVFLLAAPKREDLVHMTELHAAGTVLPVIDRSYPLAEGAEAFRLVGAGLSKGKVVITL